MTVGMGEVVEYSRRSDHRFAPLFPVFVLVAVVAVIVLFRMAVFVLPVPVVAVVVMFAVVVFFVTVVVVMFVVSVRHACESVRQGYTSRDFTNSSENSEFL